MVSLVKMVVIIMDLYAYAQIGDLEEIAKKNNINVPRLRGYRLMKDEKLIDKSEISKIVNDEEIEVIKKLCRAYPFWSTKPEYIESSAYTDMLCDYYLIKNKENKHPRYIGVRWDRIHGWKRKVAKFEIKKHAKEIKKQFDTFNKYVGRDVLYIHARIGGNNWLSMVYDERLKITTAPWFLERVDDAFDNTYCDFYAKINK